MTELHFFDPNPSGSPIVLLLHGLGVNASSWSLQFDPLIKAGFRPLAPDLPGFGQSRYDGRGWTVKRVAAALADFLVALGSSPIYLVGLSLGGMVAQQFVLDHPHLVKKLILVSSFAALRPEHSTGWFYLLRRVLLVVFKGIPEQAAFASTRLFPEPGQEALRQLFVEQIIQADPRAYRAAMLAIALFELASHACTHPRSGAGRQWCGRWHSLAVYAKNAGAGHPQRQTNHHCRRGARRQCRSPRSI